MNIVLIGAAGGIGRCLTKELLNNHELYLGGHNKSNLNSLVSEFNLSSNQVSEVDVKSFDSINDFMLSADKYLSSIDCIINCVGSLLLKPAHLTTEQDLEDVFRTNVFSCFGLLKHSFKFLKDSGGQLIFFSSAASKVGLKNHEAISSAKAAVSAMVLSAASTYARYNIRVNAIAPGLVDTPLTNKIISNKVSLDYSKSLHGLNRIGKPENFIPIINSLIDERSDWITGQTFFIDGGLSNVK